MKPLLFKLTDGGRVKVAKLPLEKMLSYIQVEITDCEAGGVMCGRFISESNDIVIDDISTPFDSDIRTRHSFFRKTLGHQEFLDQLWQQSDGTCNYIGDWHTHPEPVPKPSAKDLRNWRRLVKRTICDARILIFIIVGTVEARVWQGQLDGTITELSKV